MPLRHHHDRAPTSVPAVYVPDIATLDGIDVVHQNQTETAINEGDLDARSVRLRAARLMLNRARRKPEFR